LWLCCFEVFAGHSILCGALHTAKSNLHNIGKKLANRAHAAISQMIYIVDICLSIIDIYEVFHRSDDIFLGKRIRFYVEIKFLVELVAANIAQIILPSAKKHVVKIALGILQRYGFTWSKHRINC